MGRRNQRQDKIDGLGPREVEDIRKAVRQVWHRSKARGLCVKRCIGKDGFSYCEKCKQRAPKVTIDHIVEVGLVDGGFLERMFIPSKGLQGLCHKCHNDKTKATRKERIAASKREAADGIGDFY